VGVSSDTSPGTANFDGHGFSYSGPSLVSAGASPGSLVTAGGDGFTWPNVAPGQADNYLAAGQSIPVSVPNGTAQLGILGAAANAGQAGASGTARLNYSDGTSTTFVLSMPDWALGGGASYTLPPGFTKALSMANRNPRSGPVVAVYVFAATVPLNPAKTLVSVTLPSASSGGQLHVFALGRPST
jgi:hypothetical protein